MRHLGPNTFLCPLPPSPSPQPPSMSSHYRMASIATSGLLTNLRSELGHGIGGDKPGVYTRSPASRPTAEAVAVCKGRNDCWAIPETNDLVVTGGRVPFRNWPRRNCTVRVGLSSDEDPMVVFLIRIERLQAVEAVTLTTVFEDSAVLVSVFLGGQCVRWFAA